MLWISEATIELPTILMVCRAAARWISNAQLLVNYTLRLTRLRFVTNIFRRNLLTAQAGVHFAPSGEVAERLKALAC